jgi:hypothetical protein
MAGRALWTPLPSAEGSGMGARRSRRGRAEIISLGRGVSRGCARLQPTLEDRSRASGPVCAESVRSLQPGRQRSRVVQRLVWSGLLHCVSRAESARTGDRRAAIFPRRVLAPPCQSDEMCRAIKHSSAYAICGLWFSRGVRCGITLFSCEPIEKLGELCSPPIYFVENGS